MPSSVLRPSLSKVPVLRVWSVFGFSQRRQPLRPAVPGPYLYRTSLVLHYFRKILFCFSPGQEVKPTSKVVLLSPSITTHLLSQVPESSSHSVDSQWDTGNPYTGRKHGDTDPDRRTLTGLRRDSQRNRVLLGSGSTIVRVSRTPP